MSEHIRMDHIDQVPEAAKAVIQALGERTVLALHGDLGAGKTTLIKAMCEKMGVRDAMSSPTFAIVNEYLAAKPIFHFDLYRLEKEDELDGIGFDDYVDSGYLCFIEWPEIAGERLPDNTVHLYIHRTETERYIEIRNQ